MRKARLTMTKKTTPRRIRYVPHPDPEKANKGERVKALSIDFKPVEEYWNIYELADGTRLRVRTSIARCERPLDPQGEEFLYRPTGEPIYGVEFSVEINFDFSEDVLRK
jgi:hypothetical protein